MLCSFYPINADKDTIEYFKTQVAMMCPFKWARNVLNGPENTFLVYLATFPDHF